MSDSSAKTSLELAPDPEPERPGQPAGGPEPDPTAEVFPEAEAGEAEAVEPETEDAPADEAETAEPETEDAPADEAEAAEPETEETPAAEPVSESEAEPGEGTARKPGRRGPWLPILATLALAAGLWWLAGQEGPHGGGRTETAELADYLAPVIRAESLDQDRLDRAEQQVRAMDLKSRAARETAAGALAFLKDDLGAAHQHFAAAAVLAPELPDLVSFQAAASLRQGNPALAGDLYRRALELKAAAEPPRDQTGDQLGLALSLFFLRKPDEALPLAEEAWKTRSRTLGLEHPDTLSAANRLATILVALGRDRVAEELLKTSYRGALAGEEVEAGLEETRLLLTVLHDQSGRLDELNDFFGQDPPPKPKPKPAPAPAEAAPAAPLPPATAESLADWRRAAEGLDRADPALAADLWLRVIQGREVLEGLGRHQPPLRPDLLALARAELAAGRAERALAELRPLESMITPDSADFVDYSDLLAQALTGLGRLNEAEKHWQTAVDLVDARVSDRVRAKKAPEPQDAARSLDIHLRLADLFRRQGRVPQEAEIELRAALGRLGPKNADGYPAAARVYLSLARLMWETGQTRSAADYYQRARNLAETLGPPAGQAERETLAAVARLAAEETQALSAKNFPQAFPAVEAGEPAAEILRTPEVLRLELTALSALGRRAEFASRLEPALAEAAERDGLSSQAFMRYYSLKLKWLEEEGRIDDLSAELQAQADRPPGRNEAERALNRCSALIYAARVNEKAGRPAEAVKLYRRALAAVEGRDEPVIAARRKVVEEALERLKDFK